MLHYFPFYISCTLGNVGQLTRAAVELAKLWRTDKYLRRLDVRCLPRLAPVMCSSTVLAWMLFCEAPEACTSERERCVELRRR